MGALICAGALVAGCAGEGEPEPTATVTATETVTATPEPEPTEEADVEESASGDLGLNERGNLPMPQNSPQEFIDSASGERLLELAASEVHQDFTCNRASTIDPDGTFFAIDFSVEMTDSAVQHMENGFLLNPPHFELIDADGQVIGQEPTTHAANNCLRDEDRYPRSTVRAGSSASGPMIFETPVEAGILVYRDMYTGNYYEWEFDLN